MADIWVNDSGTARRINEVWVNDSGTARRINQIWINDSGTARLVFTGDVISISDVTASSVVASPTNATASYSLGNDGDIDRTTGTNTVSDQGDWIAPRTGMANYEARATVTSGSLSSGTEGSWLSLATTRTWSLTISGIAPGSGSCVFTLEIRRALDSVVMDTATITLTAQVT